MFKVGDRVSYEHEPVTGTVIGVSFGEHDRLIYRVEFRYAKGFAGVRSFYGDSLTIVVN